MAVQFKFRSSPIFDSIDIGNESFISIRKLKSEIVKKKHLNMSQDFDLVFSDSLSGQEYKDENVRIPSGSSVIIKRVPASSVRTGDASAVCFGGEVNHGNIVKPTLVNVEAKRLANFEVDLGPLPDKNLPGIRKMQSTNMEKKDLIAQRCSQELLVRCNELDATYPRQCAPKNSSANDGSTMVMKSKPKTEEQTVLVRTLPAKQLVTERNDMPSELKCSLCRNFFKEAVMIPCCQHSFCEKCIRLALEENAKCPMCSSTKCKAKDLLPNVSLRQAIDRFLQSQMVLNGEENDLHGFAPDGESGIQVKELSYAATINKRDLQLNNFPTKRRSDPQLQNNMRDHANPAHMKCEPDTLEDSTEFEGENDPQNVARDAEEADTCTKKDHFSVAAQGRERHLAVPSRLQRVQRTCYRCGAPDHFIRDCPIPATSQANHWNGDASVAGPTPGSAPMYWPGSPPNVGPFMNMYGSPNVVMYNVAMPPVTPYAYSPYAQSMYGAYPFPSGQINMGAGNMALANRDHYLQPSRMEVPQCHDQDLRIYNGNLQRERTAHDANGYDAHDYRGGVHHSDDSLARTSEVKHRSRNDSDEAAYSGSRRQEKRERRNHLAEDKHDKYERNSKMHVEKRDHYGYDSKTESAKKRRSGKEYHSHSRSSVERSYSGDSGRQGREESSHRYKHRKESAKSNDKEYHHHDRERMTRNSDDDFAGHSHGHNRKRFH